MNQDIVVLNEEVKRLEIPLDVASAIVASFEPHMAKYLEVVTGIEKIDQAMPKSARQMRLYLVKVRTATEAARKDMKADLLDRGKAIDGIAALITLKCKENETYLEAIEKAEERRLAEEKEKLRQTRSMALAEYVDNVYDYNVADMSETEFSELLSAQKLVRQARLEAEKAAAEAEAKRMEEERLAAVKQQERDAKERARLQAELAEQLKQRKIAEAQARAERLEREAAEKKQRELQDKIKAHERAEAQRLAAEREAANRDAQVLPISEIDKRSPLEVSADEGSEITKLMMLMDGCGIKDEVLMAVAEFFVRGDVVKLHKTFIRVASLVSSALNYKRDNKAERDHVFLKNISSLSGISQPPHSPHEGG